jgi:outer membrane murein-binding lipoprotein Lpp
MKTTSSMRIAGAIFSAGILLTSCVSSKKYHKSQDEVAKLRSDSTALAQQASTLQQHLTTTEQKNADLQKSVETANNSNAGLQKNVAYYSDFAGKQSATTSEIKGELATTLAAAGIAEQDVMLNDGKIYVNIGEKSLFKGNTAMLSTKGKELVENLGQFVKTHESVDVTVADLEMATSTAGTDAAGGSMESTDKTSTASSQGTQSNSDYTITKTKTGTTSSTSMKRKQPRHIAPATAKAKQPVAGESRAVTYSSGKKKSYVSTARAKRAIAWQRQNTVADAMLKTGIPKVKLVSQLQPSGNGTIGSQKGVQVVLVHDMDNFYKHMSEAPVGQPVSKNP